MALLTQSDPHIGGAPDPDERLKASLAALGVSFTKAAAALANWGAWVSGLRGRGPAKVAYSMAPVKFAGKPELDPTSVKRRIYPGVGLPPGYKTIQLEAQTKDGRSFAFLTYLHEGALPTYDRPEWWQKEAGRMLQSLTRRMRPRYRLAVASKAKRPKVRPPHSRRPSHKRRVYG